MAWTSLSYSFGSLLTATKMTQLYDNITAQANGDSGAPKQQSAGIGSGQVKQGNLATSTAENSSTSVNLSFVATGGTYIIGWELKTSLSSDSVILNTGDYLQDTSSSVTTSYTATYHLRRVGSSTSTTVARHTYVTASPPYKLGQTDYPYFAYALLDSNNNILGTSAAMDPPWAYNGPFKGSADTYEMVNGVLTPKIIELEITQELKDLARQDPRAYLQEKRKLTPVEKVLTPELKNRNMSYSPSPLLADTSKGERVVLIAPDDNFIRLMEEVHPDQDVTFIDLLQKDYVRLGQPVSIPGSPKGVEIVRAIVVP